MGTMPLAAVQIPKNVNAFTLKFGEQAVNLSNLQKLSWPDLGITKRDLLACYADIFPVLLAPSMASSPNGSIAGRVRNCYVWRQEQTGEPLFRHTQSWRSRAVNHPPHPPHS
jgi:hypothetical protein